MVRLMLARLLRTGVLAVAAFGLIWSISHLAAYWQENHDSKLMNGEVRSLYYQDSANAMNLNEVNKQLVAVNGLPVAPKDMVAVRPVQPKFVDLLKQNEDIVGWLHIADTEIDYPVLQAKDNEYYLHHDVNKNTNRAGSIFVDYRNTLSAATRNTILYGHHMKNGTMLADLLQYASRWNFENKKIIHFDTLAGDQQWIIFSAYTTDPTFDYIRTDFLSDEDYQQFLNDIKAKSRYPSAVEVKYTDSILTLSTCAYAYPDARFVVHAKLLASP
ncbi:MAG: class B sortase [Gorillibacterium sp.]|nr:class B sortase [Gorillibacterium sp.]